MPPAVNITMVHNSTEMVTEFPTHLEMSKYKNITGEVIVGLSTRDFPDVTIKEVIIVTIMLGMWLYSILLTKRAWKQFLRD